MRFSVGSALIKNAAMATVIFAMGCALLFSDLYVDLIKNPNRIYLAFIFFAYASFRYWRAWSAHRIENESTQNNEPKKIK